MKKPKFETPNLTAENVAKIAELFPGVVTEGKVNIDLLRSMLGEEVFGDEAYEFTWVGKRAAIAEAGRPIRKTLRPCVEESKDWDTTENLYIEGDNLDVLKLLQESYLGKIKMCYIDPPYNTGKDSFLYRDKFTMDADEYDEAVEMYDEEGMKNFRENVKTNPRYHSDWCTSIYPVLVLARNILSDDGIILINMDENEIINLQKLCAEVFGESNDLGTIIWDKRNPKGDAKGISYQHEYIVAYAKNKLSFVEKCKMQRPKKNAAAIIAKANQVFKKVGAKYTLEEANREFASWVSAQDDFSGGEKAYNRIDQNGDVYRPVSMAWPNKKKAPDDYFIPLIHPITKKPCPLPERGWRNPSATMNELLREGLILFGKDETTQPNRKYLLKENMYENIPSLLYYGGSDTDLLAELEIPFDTPKVVSIVKEHIQSFTADSDIVLDFYSGSATTAHAVMQLNAEDGNKRKFIMVQLPEAVDNVDFPTICEIGKERIRRAGDKIKEEAGLTAQNLDIGFRVLKLDDTNMNEVYYAAGDYTQDLILQMESNIKPDRTDMDLLYGCLLDWGLPLSMPHTHEKIDGFTVHTYNDGDLIACFEERISEKAIREIASRKPLRAVFRDSSFNSSPEKINVFEIFKLLAPNTNVRVI
ncbi:MAG: site-specific DNA-methyltransferase [Sphaerochaetaceae bacterium]|nr:site-specific DNA-methyltransferase [Sphaerochaetaceae bacterium]